MNAPARRSIPARSVGLVEQFDQVEARRRATKPNVIDRAIEYFAPQFGRRRLISRLQTAEMRQFEAAKIGRERPNDRSRGSADAVVRPALEIIRDRARYADENHDLASGVLDVLTSKVVGKQITTHPMARLTNGEMAVDLNKWLTDNFARWSERCDASGELSWPSAQRMLYRSKIRDGDVFVRDLVGAWDPGHATPVPYTIELIEADQVPNTYSVKLSENRFLRQGIVFDEWGRPIEYAVLKDHPGDVLAYAAVQASTEFASKLLRAGGQMLDARFVHHMKCAKRIRQSRGVSVLAPVLNRIDDLKDYEDSDRLAARIGAYIALQITKSLDYDVQGKAGDPSPRELDFMPGMIFDGLAPGEKIEQLENKRPSNTLDSFRSSILRAVAAGTNAGYSSISKNYDGTYSAQRQELKEQEAHYAVATDEFVKEIVRPVYRRFVEMALAARLIPSTLLSRVDRDTLSAAAYRGPSVAYIDPVKEINHEILAVQAGFRSKRSVILAHGGNPDEVENEIIAERDAEENAGVVNTSNPKNKVGVLDLSQVDTEPSEQSGQTNQ